MGKIKIITKEEETKAESNDIAVSDAPKAVKVPKKKVVAGTLHVEATFNNTKVVLSDKDGNTIFWTSAGSLGFKGAKKGTPFAASKAGQIAISKSLSKEVAKRGITVNNVCPGFIDTELLADLPEEQRKEYMKDVPMKRFGKVEEGQIASIENLSELKNLL